jgi:hypothetical protein
MVIIRQSRLPAVNCVRTQDSTLEKDAPTAVVRAPGAQVMTRSPNTSSNAPGDPRCTNMTLRFSLVTVKIESARVWLKTHKN